MNFHIAFSWIMNYSNGHYYVLLFPKKKTRPRLIIRLLSKQKFMNTAFEIMLKSEAGNYLNIKIKF